MKRNARLNRLFASWPARRRRDFHRDGIISEEEFSKQRRRVLYVMAEPSSRGPRFAHLLGSDLRRLYESEPPKKELTHNIALWTEVLLDGRSRYERLSPDSVRAAMRRVAIMNLKKLSGTGSADYSEISAVARADRKFLLRQIDIISPDIIVACGKPVSRILKRIFEGERARNVIEASHPSCRPNHGRVAWKKLVKCGP